MLASLIACLLVLPTMRSAGEVHLAVAHVEQPQWHAHESKADATHVDDEHADASAMHRLMHLPAASADTVALVVASLTTGELPAFALPPELLGPAAEPSRTPSAPYRPPILG